RNIHQGGYTDNPRFQSATLVVKENIFFDAEFRNALWVEFIQRHPGIDLISFVVKDRNQHAVLKTGHTVLSRQFALKGIVLRTIWRQLSGLYALHNDLHQQVSGDSVDVVAFVFMVNVSSNAFIEPDILEVDLGIR